MLSNFPTFFIASIRIYNLNLAFKRFCAKYKAHKTLQTPYNNA